MCMQDCEEFVREVLLAGHAQEGRSCGHESAHLNQQHSRAYDVVNLRLSGIRAHGLYSHSAIQRDLSSHTLGLLEWILEV